jgi:hypothetical protein
MTNHRRWHDIPKYYNCQESFKRNNSIAQRGVKKPQCSFPKLGDKNPMWKGENVSYGGLHDYIKRHLSKPKLCQHCKSKSPYDCANISGEYKRDLSDWEWLCRSCHMKLDGRINNLKQFRGLNV